MRLPGATGVRGPEVQNGNWLTLYTMQSSSWTPSNCLTRLKQHRKPSVTDWKMLCTAGIRLTAMSEN
jgi:hypothetical protein